MNEKPTKLRPVVYTANYFKSGHQNTTQQIFLLKALQITQDPKKLRDMLGVKTVAEVYRTLDKISMRKEYHEALATNGISFDFMVKGIKDIALTGFKDGDKLKAYQTLLKSVGMEKYDDASVASDGTWEELLLKKIEEDKKSPEAPQLEAPKPYDVVIPEIPESAKRIMEEEKEIASSIYDNK